MCYCNKYFLVLVTTELIIICFHFVEMDLFRFYLCFHIDFFFQLWHGPFWSRQRSEAIESSRRLPGGRYSQRWRNHQAQRTPCFHRDRKVKYLFFSFRNLSVTLHNLPLIDFMCIICESGFFCSSAKLTNYCCEITLDLHFTEIVIFNCRFRLKN